MRGPPLSESVTCKGAACSVNCPDTGKGPKHTGELEESKGFSEKEEAPWGPCLMTQMRGRLLGVPLKRQWRGKCGVHARPPSAERGPRRSDESAKPNALRKFFAGGEKRGGLYCIRSAQCCAVCTPQSPSSATRACPETTTSFF